MSRLPIDPSSSGDAGAAGEGMHTIIFRADQPHHISAAPKEAEVGRIVHRLIETGAFERLRPSELKVYLTLSDMADERHFAATGELVTCTDDPSWMDRARVAHNAFYAAKRRLLELCMISPVFVIAGGIRCEGYRVIPAEHSVRKARATARLAVRASAQDKKSRSASARAGTTSTPPRTSSAQESTESARAGTSCTLAGTESAQTRTANSLFFDAAILTGTRAGAPPGARADFLITDRSESEGPFNPQHTGDESTQRPPADLTDFAARAESEFPARRASSEPVDPRGRGHREKLLRACGFLDEAAVREFAILAERIDPQLIHADIETARMRAKQNRGGYLRALLRNRSRNVLHKDQTAQGAGGGACPPRPDPRAVAEAALKQERLEIDRLANLPAADLERAIARGIEKLPPLAQAHAAAARAADLLAGRMPTLRAMVLAVLEEAPRGP